MATVNRWYANHVLAKLRKATCLRWKHARKNVAYVLVYILPLLKTELRAA